MTDESSARQTDAQFPEAILHLLSDARRRRAVAVLADRDAPMALRNLAAAVAATERGAPPDDVPAGEIDELATALHHVHAPKLDDAGVVDYDAETNTVVPARTEAVESFARSADAPPQNAF